MKRFQKILIWFEDEDERAALERACAVARETGATLTLTHAFERPSRVFRALYPQAGELHSFVLSEWKEKLEAIADPLRKEGLEVSTRVLEGKPYIAVVREVLSAGHDLVVKAAQQTDDGPLFGSRDMHLLRKCPCAVWIARPNTAPAMRLLATVDPDPRDEALNRRILETASSLAEMRGATLDVLNVWQPFAVDVLRRHSDEAEIKAYVKAAQAKAKEDLAKLFETTGRRFPKERVHLIRGEARFAIPEYVRRHDVGLLVMGTVCRTGIPGFLIGNTAEETLARVRCSVLTLKPEGFTSPITLEE